MVDHYRSLEEVQLSQSWLTIGTFDGVHLGHQRIIRSLVDQAHQHQLPAAVVTFHPHPTLVLRGGQSSYYLTLPEKRAQLLGEIGVDVVVTHPFTRKTSRLTAKEFVSRLHRRLHFSQLWIGHDFALGKDRKGNAERLRELGNESGFILKKIPALSLDGKLVSSSLIRRLLREGNVSQAAEYLGRPFSLPGEVIPGDSRGKNLGFPTSNLDVPEDLVALSPGVYACYVEMEGKSWQAVTNIGYRPTFGGQEERTHIEAHLLDFNQEIYGKEMELFFVERLRPEKKFSQVSELQSQIRKDILRARQIFQEN